MEEIDYDNIGCLFTIGDELEKSNDELVKDIGMSILKSYQILLAKKKLQEGDYDIHSYNQKIIELI